MPQNLQSLQREPPPCATINIKFKGENMLDNLILSNLILGNLNLGKLC